MLVFFYYCLYGDIHSIIDNLNCILLTVPYLNNPLIFLEWYTAQCQHNCESFLWVLYFRKAYFLMGVIAQLWELLFSDELTLRECTCKERLETGSICCRKDSAAPTTINFFFFFTFCYYKAVSMKKSNPFSPSFLASIIWDFFYDNSISSCF